jgi:hypothetical protein
VAAWHAPQTASRPRVRRPGGGRTRTVPIEQTLQDALAPWLDPLTRGAPAAPWRWTGKRGRQLGEALRRLGPATRQRLVATLLHALGSSLQANRQPLAGPRHPAREAPCASLHAKVQAAWQAGEPVIAGEAQTKALVGDGKPAGRAGPPAGPAVPGRVDDCGIPARGRGTPYGVDERARQAGWGQVGTEHPTAACAGARLRRWWPSRGQSASPPARTVLSTAAGGGRKGARVRRWHRERQRCADEPGVESAGSHCPPGTRKWHKSEQRRFSCLSQHWRGKPLVSHAVMVPLMAATTTTTGLTVVCPLDQHTSPAGGKVSPKAREELHLQRDTFHGAWNDTILPSQQP